VKYLLYHGPTGRPARCRGAVRRAGRTSGGGRGAEIHLDDRPTVYSWTRRPAHRSRRRRWSACGSPVSRSWPSEAGRTGCAGGTPGGAAGGVCPLALPQPRAAGLAQGRVPHLGHGRETARIRAESAARLNELTELAEIGVLLTTEKNLDTLLELILSQARRVTQSTPAASTSSRPTKPAPAGCASSSARTTAARTFHSSNSPSRSTTPPRRLRGDRGGTAGDRGCVHAAAGRGVLLQPSFDDRYGYRTRSMLVIPCRIIMGK